jgi:hypothetical protein
LETCPNRALTAWLCSRQLVSVVLCLINWIGPRLFDFPSAGGFEPSLPRICMKICRSRLDLTVFAQPKHSFALSWNSFADDTTHPADIWFFGGGIRLQKSWQRCNKQRSQIAAGLSHTVKGFPEKEHCAAIPMTGIVVAHAPQP